MLIDFRNATSEVYGDKTGRAYKVKISFPDVGLYIGAIRVIEAMRGNDDYVVYAPKVHVGNQVYLTNYEFDKSGELWRLIEDLATSAVDRYKAKQRVVIAGKSEPSTF